MHGREAARPSRGAVGRIVLALLVIAGTLTAVVASSPPAGADPVTPTSPAAVVDSTTPTTADLSWTGASPGTWTIQYSTDPSFATGVVTLAGLDGSLATDQITGLAMGTTYYAELASVDGTTGSWVSFPAVTTVPAAPVGLTATPSDGQVSLGWGATTGADGYRVSQDGTQIADQTGTTDTVSGITDGTSYSFTVTAYDSAGVSTASTAATATPEPPAPGTPTGLAAASVTATGATLSWNPVIGAGGYQLFAGTQLVADVSTTTATDTTEAAGAAVTYAVAAYNAGGASTASAPLDVTTLPAVPTGLAASGVSATGATLSWMAVTGATGYVLTSGSTSGPNVVYSGTATSFTDTTEAPNSAVSYTVTAVDSSGNSSPSTDVTIATLAAPPTGVSVTLSGTGATISWTATSGATGYQVFSGTGTTPVYVGTATSYTDTSATSPATTYSYTVTVTTAAGTSAASGAVSATTVPATPTGLTGTASAPGELSLSWSPSTGASGYQVFQDGTQIADQVGTSLVVSGLTNEQAYAITVLAYSSAGASPASAAVTLIPLPAAPGTPTGLAASGITAVGATLSWTPVATADGYRLYGGGALIYQGTTTSFTDTTESAGATLSYTVASYNGGGTSAQSTALNVLTVPASPAAPAVTPVTSTTAPSTTNGAAVTWSASTGATSYQLSANGVAIYTGSATTYTDLADHAGASVDYTVTAIDASGSSGSSAATTITAAPTPPAGVMAVSQTHDTGVALSWTASAGASSYVIFRNGVSGVLATTSATTYLDTSVTTPSTTYTYTIEALSAGGGGGGGSYESDGSAATPATTVLASPAGPAATGTTASSTTLNWSGVTGASSYVVYQNGTSVATPTLTNATVSGLTAGTTYTFTVTATNAIGESATSTPTVVTTIPPAPTGLAASAPTVSGATLSWPAVRGATTYKLYAGATLVYTGSALTFTDTSEHAVTTYTYTATATNAAGTSPASAGVVVTTLTPTPAAPTIAAYTSASPATTNGITVSWTAVTGANRYEVFRSGTPTPIYVGTAISYVDPDSGVAPLTGYTYSVAAATTSGTFSPPSTGTTVTSAPATPTGLTATSLNGGGIALAWTATAGATSYAIYRGTAKVATSSTPSYTDAGATSTNTAYTYAIEALTSASVSSNASTTATATTVLAAPVFTAATGVTTTALTLNWGAVTGASSGYQLFVGGVLVYQGTATTFTDTAKTPGTYYVYTVKAGNANGWSAASGAQGVSMLSVVPSTPAVTPIVATGPSASNGALITWYLSAGTASSYKVFASTSSTPIYTGAATTYNDYATYGGASVSYTVESTSSSTYSAPSPATTIATAPPVPVGVTAAPITGDAGVTLAWTPSSGATSYAIYRNGLGAGYLLLTTTTNSAGYTDGSADTPNTSYTYYVEAVSSGGYYSDQSSAVSATMPPMVSAPALAADPTNPTTSVDLSWDPISGDTTELQYSNSPSFPSGSTTDVTGLTGGSYVATGLAAVSPFYAQLRAILPSGQHSSWITLAQAPAASSPLAYGQVTTVVGSGAAGNADGAGTSASFQNLGVPLVVNPSTAYVTSGLRVRQVSLATGQTNTVANLVNFSCPTVLGYAAGPSFLEPSLASDGSYLYAVLDCAGTEFNQEFVVRITLGGSSSGTTAVIASPAAVAMIGNAMPTSSVAVGPNGYLYYGNGTAVDYLVSPQAASPASSVLVSTLPAGTTTTGTAGQLVFNGTSLLVEVVGLHTDASGMGYAGNALDSVNTTGTPVVSTVMLNGVGTTVAVTGGKIYTFDQAYPTQTATGTVSYQYGQGPLVSYPAITPTTPSFVVGAGGTGSADGTGIDGWFSSRAGIASDGTNLWVSDGNTLREVTAATPPTVAAPTGPAAVTIGTGVVTTLAGSGAPDNNPGDMAAPGTAVVVVSDSYVPTTTEIQDVNLATHAVSVLAGSATAGTVDSLTPSQVRFDGLVTMVTYGDYLYSLQETTTTLGAGNRLAIRRTTLSGPARGATSTVYANNMANSWFTSLAIGSDGNLYLGGHYIWLTYTNGPFQVSSWAVYQVNPSTGVTSVYLTDVQMEAAWSAANPGLPAATGLTGVSVYGYGGSLYVAPVVYYGYPFYFSHYPLMVNPVGTSTLSVVIPELQGIQAMAPDGPNLYVADRNAVFAVAPTSGGQATATLVAGNPYISTSVDGTGSQASFAGITGLTVSGSSLLVSSGNQLRQITTAPPGTVATTPHATEGAGNPSHKSCQACSGDPVNTESGNFYLNPTDLSVAGLGAPLTFARTYNSNNAVLTPQTGLGYGWSSTWSDSLAVDPTNTTSPPSVLDEISADGSVTPFTQSTSGAWVAPTGTLATLVKNSNGTFTYTVMGQTSYSFTAPVAVSAPAYGPLPIGSWTPGKLTAVSTPNGYTDTVSYNTNSQVSQVADSSGRHLTFTYNSSQKLTSVADPMGHTETFTYDGSGNLASATDPNGHTTTYAYTSANQLTVETGPNGAVLTNTYAAGLVASQTSPLGAQLSFAYSAGVTSGTGTTTVTTTLPSSPGSSTSTLYQYVQGDMTSKTTSGTGVASATSTYAHDPATNGLTSWTDPLGRTTTYTYDAAGNTTSTTDPSGSVTSATYNSFGEPLTQTDALGNVTTHTYDTHGNPLTSTATLSGDPSSSSPQTVTSTYAYTGAAGEVTSVTDALGHATAFTYDSYGNVTSSTGPATAAAPSGAKTTYTYNADGQRLTSVSPRGNLSGATPSQFTTTSTYDLAGNTLSSTDPNGHATSATYTPANRQATTTDPLGHVTTYTYDADGNLTHTTNPDGTSTSATYDAADHPLTTTNGSGNVTTHTYDAYGRPTTSTDPSGAATTMTYDAANQPVTSTTPDGQVTTSAYTPTGKVSSLTYSGTGPATTAVAYAYTTAGQLSSMTDASGTTTYTRNSFGQLTGLTQGDGETVGYTHNLGGQTTTLTYPGTIGSVTQSYDAAGDLTGVTDPTGVASSFTYDANGAPTGSTLANGVAGASTYDHAGVPTSVGYTVGGAATATFAYTNNAANQVTSEADSGSATTGGTTSSTTTYGYTSASRLRSSTSTASAPASGSFTYGSAGQLTASTATAQATYGPTTALCWTLPTGATTITSPSCSSTPTGATGYVTNAEGQRTASTTPAQLAAGTSTGYAWDASGQLTGVTAGTVAGTTGPTANTATGYTLQYSYSGAGLRMTSTLIPASGTGSPATQDFAYDPTQTVPTVLSDGDFAFVYGSGGTPIEQLPLATGTTSSAPALVAATNTGTPATGTTTLLTDAHGSVRALVGTSGTVPTVEAALTYDAYGHATSLAGLPLSSLAQPGSPLGDIPGGPAGALTPLGYTGAYTDGQTGLEYLVHRYYDPTTGTFLSVDPLVGLTGDPYGYVGGNPTNAVDPLGLSWYNPASWSDQTWKDVAVGAGVVLGVAAAATGVGAVVELGAAVAAGTALSGTGVGLAVASAGFGFGAVALDAGPCKSSDYHDAAACTGAGFGAAGAVVGLSALGLPEAIAQVLGIWAMGTAFFTAVVDASSIPASTRTSCTKP